MLVGYHAWRTSHRCTQHHTCSCRVGTCRDARRSRHGCCKYLPATHTVQGSCCSNGHRPRHQSSILARCADGRARACMCVLVDACGLVSAWFSVCVWGAPTRHAANTVEQIIWRLTFRVALLRSDARKAAFNPFVFRNADITTCCRYPQHYETKGNAHFVFRVMGDRS